MMLPTQDKEAIAKISKDIENGLIAQDKIYNMEIEGTIMTFSALAENFAYLSAYIFEREGYHKGLPSNIEEALNSGDGVYRP